MYSCLDFPNGLEGKKSNQYTLILLVSEVQSSQGILSCEKPLLKQLVFEILPSLFLPPFTPFVTGKLLLVPLFLCIVSFPPPAWLMVGGKCIIQRTKISKPHVLYFRKQAKWENFNFHTAVTYSHICSGTEVNINNGDQFSDRGMHTTMAVLEFQH